MLQSLGWSVTAGAAGLVASALFAYLAALEKHQYLRFWSAAWAAGSIAILASGFAGIREPLFVAIARLAFSALLLAGTGQLLSRRDFRQFRIQATIAYIGIIAIIVALFGHGGTAISALAAVQLVAAGIVGAVARPRIGSYGLLFATVLGAAAFTGDMYAETFAYAAILTTMFCSVFEEKREQAISTTREVERLAFHDSLTDLPNRLLFMDRAGIAFAHAKRAGTQVAVAFLDLDRFKVVNDTFGHDVGDDALRAIAGRLCDALREGDTIARLGGDEFTLLLPGICKIDDITRIASKLLDVFRVPLRIADNDIMVTASIGVSIFPDDGGDAEALVRNADAAMYRAKDRGGESFQMYTPSLNENARRELEIETRLRLGVARNEFVLYYQPRVDAAMERVVAFEALLRWHDPEHGLVMPADFIQIAEASGLIISIGHWVLRTACIQAREWQRTGKDLYVSVNLSPRQFHHRDLNETITDALIGARLEPRFLELEVDESCVMNNADASMRILNDLKTLGVRVLISHFGTGYSSLRNLRRFPIDGLKLDRSFSSGIDRSLATAALGMAKALRLKVIGEGVETHEDAEFLRANACDDIQGFLVSAAVSVEECDLFMARQVGRKMNAVSSFPNP